jgi:large subunit ribosomal protein L22
LDKNNLFIREIKIDEGKTLYRWTPRALGRATPIRKRTSHINLTLGEVVDSGVVEPKKQEIDAPISLEDMAKGQSEKGKGEKEQGNKDRQSKKKHQEDSGAKNANAELKKEKTGKAKIRAAKGASSDKK